MDWAVFPPCLLFDLRYSSTGAYKLLGGLKSQCQNGEFRRVHTNEYSLVPLPPASLPPQWAIGNPCLPRKPSRTHRSVWCSGSQCTWNFVCTLQQWSLCFPLRSPVEFLHSSPTGLESHMLQGLLFPMPESLCWGAWPEFQNSHSCERTSVI